MGLVRHHDVGEEDFYTNSSAISAYQTVIGNQNETANPYNVMGFGWCWDMTWQNAPGGTIDPVHQVIGHGSPGQSHAVDAGQIGRVGWGLNILKIFVFTE